MDEKELSAIEDNRDIIRKKFFKNNQGNCQICSIVISTKNFFAKDNIPVCAACFRRSIKKVEKVSQTLFLPIQNVSR